MYELHQQLQTYILFYKYRQLIMITSTLRTGTVLPKQSQTMGYTTVTTRKTVNWFARKQLHFNYVVPEGTKGAINLFIKLEKNNLNQIDWRNIRTSLQKRVAYGVSEEKNRTWVNMICVIRSNIQTYAILTNSSNEKTGPSATILNTSKQHFTEEFLFSTLYPSKANVVQYRWA